MTSRSMKVIAAVLSTVIFLQTVVVSHDSYAGLVDDAVLKNIFGIDNEVAGTVLDNSFGIGSGLAADHFIASQNAKLQEYWNLAVRGVPVNDIAGDTISNIRSWRSAGSFLKWGGAAIGAIDTISDTFKIIEHVRDPSKTKYQQGWSTGAKFVDNLMYMGGNYAGWLTTGYTIAGIFSPAAVATGVGAVVTGTWFAAGVATVAVARAIYKSETFANIVDLARGNKKLVFAPFYRPNQKEGLDIIKEELGFDLYDHSGNEIPDPSTGIPVYKPNIYLYGKEDKHFSVKLLNEGYITKSIPRHVPNKGWDAYVKNGSINGKDDFLFYEAIVPDTSFQKKTGWIVRSGHLREDMMKILREYGFNSKEKRDFIEFWENKLSNKKDYVFYNQETNLIDSIMPIWSSPSPKHSYRIWFYIEECGKSKVSLETPSSISVIESREDTLVEWGGVYR